MEQKNIGADHDEDLALKIENVGKDYFLGAVTGNTLKDSLREKTGRGSKKPVSNKAFTALDGISFEVRKGETVGLIGSNGAGKSTLLKLISRITSPTRGKIYIDGRISSMLEVGTGFHPELTGRENIYLNGSILGMTRKEIDAKLDSIIEFSEIGEFIDTPVKRYSSGMYVKLAFSVSAHLDSEIMIMDEVLAVGDMKFQQKCLNKMKEIAETEGRTIIYVSHNMDTIHKLCKRCIVLDHGHMVFDGDVSEATKIYIGENIKTDTTADFSKYVRPGWLQRDELRLTWAEYPDMTDNVVKDGKIDILFKWTLNADVKNGGIRVELLDDAEKQFATAVFYDQFTGTKGDCGTNTVSVNLSNIMPGEYKTYYTVFAMTDDGEDVDLDCVRGLDLKIEESSDTGKLRWLNQSWGNVILK